MTYWQIKEQQAIAELAELRELALRQIHVGREVAK